MSKDLEYLAARNFMFNGYYDLPSAERPGFLHVYEPADGSWDALEEAVPQLLASPEVLSVLTQTIFKNIVEVNANIRTRHQIASVLSSALEAIAKGVVPEDEGLPY
jgi:hypothetical protein